MSFHLYASLILETTERILIKFGIAQSILRVVAELHFVCVGRYTPLVLIVKFTSNLGLLKTTNIKHGSTIFISNLL
jgi:hypothetical protein